MEIDTTSGTAARRTGVPSLMARNARKMRSDSCVQHFMASFILLLLRVGEGSSQRQTFIDCDNCWSGSVPCWHAPIGLVECKSDYSIRGGGRKCSAGMTARCKDIRSNK